MTAKKAKAPANLREFFDAKKGNQAELVRRCKAAGHPVSQAHLSRVAAGESCSLALAKLLSQLTGLPVESFGEKVA